MAYSRRSYKGAPVANAIGGSNLAAGATSITLASSISGSWATSNEPFFVVIDPGTSKEEKVCVVYNTATNLVVVDPAATSGWVTPSAAGRGVDDTTDRQHDIGAVIYPVFTSIEANQANELVSKYGTNGDLVTHGSTGLKKVSTGGAGNNNKVLIADSTVDGGVKWGQVTSAGITDSTIVLADLAASLQAYLVPVGTINAYAGATAPTGWLLCNGTATTGYTALAALVGATTPDLQGHTLVGKSASAPFDGALLSKFGSTTSTAPHTHDLGSHTHTFSGTSNPMNQNSTLSHTVNDSGHSHTVNGEGANAYSASDFIVGVLENAFAVDPYTESTASSTTGISVNPHDVSHTHTYGGTTAGPTGGSGASSAGTTHGNVQPSALVNYIIKHD